MEKVYESSSNLIMLRSLETNLHLALMDVQETLCGFMNRFHDVLKDHRNVKKTVEWFNQENGTVMIENSLSCLKEKVNLINSVEMKFLNPDERKIFVSCLGLVEALKKVCKQTINTESCYKNFDVSFNRKMLWDVSRIYKL